MYRAKATNGGGNNSGRGRRGLRTFRNIARGVGNVVSRARNALTRRGGNR